MYLMKDAAGLVLYAGKAKNLRKRLASYFRGKGASPKTRAMLGRAIAVETISTATEKEALLLEAGLIKKHRPRYNIVLRDDKEYVLFKLSKAHEFPRLSITRRVLRDGCAYFGPYTSASFARGTLKAIGRVFPLRKCSDRAFRNRVRPCLYHDMGQCPAPCVLKVPKEDYARSVRQVELFLSGRSSELLKQLEKEMSAASDALLFERAARLRDQIRAVRATVEKQAVVLPDRKDMDVWAPAETENALGLALLIVRRGRLLDKKTFFQPGLKLIDAPEAMESFLNRFYGKTRFIPEKIVLPWRLPGTVLSEALSERRGRKVVLSQARSGAGKRLLEMAKANALEAARKGASSQAVPPGLARVLGVKGPLERMEAVDVSHSHGKGARAGHVVFEHGAFAPDQYRAYSLPELSGRIDDCAALSAWVSRRLDLGQPWPDLLLIDGGRAQLSAVQKALAKTHQAGKWRLLSLAKTPDETGRPERRAGALSDRVFLPGRKNPLPLRPGGLELLFLQGLRDKAHEFVIGRQRRTRKREMLAGGLLNLPGIGPKTARLLWDRFASVSAMREATPKELAALSGLGRKRAEKIFKALRELQG